MQTSPAPAPSKPRRRVGAAPRARLGLKRKDFRTIPPVPTQAESDAHVGEAALRCGIREFAAAGESQRKVVFRLLVAMASVRGGSLAWRRGWVRSVQELLEGMGAGTSAASVRWMRSTLQADPSVASEAVAPCDEKTLRVLMDRAYGS